MQISSVCMATIRCVLHHTLTPPDALPPTAVLHLYQTDGCCT